MIRTCHWLPAIGAALLVVTACKQEADQAPPETVIKEVAAPVIHLAFQNQERSSIAVDYGKSIIVMDSDMKKKYSLVLTAGDVEAVHYEWKSLDEPQASGSGELFEKYEVDPNSPEGERRVIDVGSQTILKLPEFQLAWSKRADDSGWIYYGDSKAVVAVSLDHRSSFLKGR